MRRLDEDRYIDPELITHAEYQLFIDERRAAGEDRRPVHWDLDRFAESQGANPIVGLSFDDAVAFCDWLTERQGGEWRFRLPTLSERARGDCDDGSKSAIPWAVDVASGRSPAPWPLPIETRQREIVLKGSEQPRPLGVARRLALARDPARTLARDFERALARALVLAYALDLDRDLAHVRDLDLDLARDLAHVHKRALAPDLDLAHALVLARDLARARALARTLVLARALVPALDFALDLDLARALAARGRARARADHTRFDHDLKQVDRVEALLRGRAHSIQLVFILMLADAATALGRSGRFRIRAWLLRFWRGRASTGRYARLIETAKDAAWELHMAARLADARRRGEDPPFESLQLVRERVDRGRGHVEGRTISVGVAEERTSTSSIGYVNGKASVAPDV